MEKEQEIEIRSDEVQEILSHVPTWMIRYGISIIFGMILLFITLTYFIRYPDIISGSMTLTTVTPPVKLVTKSNGEIEELFIQDNSFVNKGDRIAQIRNPLSKDAVDYLKEFILQIELGLHEDFNLPVTFLPDSLVLGSIQNEYNELENAVTEFRMIFNGDQYIGRQRILEKQIQNYQKLNLINNRQLDYASDDFERSVEEYESNKELYAKGIISKIEFYEQEKKFTQSKNELENLKKNGIQNAITQTDYERQLNDLKIEFLTRKTTLIQVIESRLNSIRNEINNWEETFVITAPITGRISFLGPLSENQFIEAGKELFAVVPIDADEFIGYIQVDKTGYGKVEIGQSVRIKFDNFPAAEYGQVNGIVSHISAIPTEEKYTIQVQLPNGLMTTYKKELSYSPEMSGQADIITEDLRILDRIFNQFRKLFDE